MGQGICPIKIKKGGNYEKNYVGIGLVGGASDVDRMCQQVRGRTNR